MTDQQKAIMYYGALLSILERLEKHSSTTDSWRENRLYLMGYVRGILGDVNMDKK